MQKKRFCAMAMTAILLLNLTPVLGEERQPTTTIAPSGVIVTAEERLLIADTYSKGIWEQLPDGVSKRIAGREGVLDVNGDPIGGYHDGAAKDAAFLSPWAIAPFGEGYAITDTQNHVVRFYAKDKVSTLAGAGTIGANNDTGVKASFSHPTGLVADGKGGLFVADTGNSVIRFIDAQGLVSTYAGSDEGCADGSLSTVKFNEPTGLFFQDGVLYVADTGNHRICKIENGMVTTLAGGLTSEAGLIDGNISMARFEAPQGVLVEGNTIYIADTGNGAIRVLKDGIVSTLFSMGELKNGLFPVSPRSLCFVGDSLYVGDVFSRMLLSIPLTKTTEVPTRNPFLDVPDDRWFAPAVQRVRQKNLLLGTSDTMFSPQGTTTRAMVVTVLSRMERLSDPNVKIMGEHPFTDVPRGAYFTNSVGWANTAGIGSGITKTEFMPNATITRGELVSFLYRYGSYKKLTSLSEKMDLSGFIDSKELPTYTQDAFAWACATGLVVGNTEKALCATDPVTRGELAVMVDRFLTLT